SRRRHTRFSRDWSSDVFSSDLFFITGTMRFPEGRAVAIPILIKRKNINIGMATALPSGNLIVPVIKNADQLSLVGLSKAVNDLRSEERRAGQVVCKQCSLYV